MNVVIVCQKCRKPLKIPADGLGKKVRCPACKTTFVGNREPFKPGALTPAPPHLSDEAITSSADSSHRASDHAIANGPADDVAENAHATMPRSQPRKKKGSKLWLILLLVGILLVLPALGCVGVVVFCLFYTVPK